MKRRNLFIAALAAVAVLPLFPVPDYWISLFNYVGLYSLVALGLVLLTGVGGLTSFGQAAFVGLGAYSTAYLSVGYGLSPWIGLCAGLAITGVSAWVIGHITLRMSGHYLALATIAWGISLYFIFGNLEFLNKYDGLSGLPPIRLFGLDLASGRAVYWLVWAVVAASAFALHNLLDSRPGRAIRALKGGAHMAEAMGVDTFRMKLAIFVISALLASLSGWMYAHFQRTVNPSPFGLGHGIEYLFMAVVGGVGHLGGAILGAGLLTFLKDGLQSWLPALLGSAGNYEMIVFGVMMVLLLQFAPEGLWPLLARLFPRQQAVVAPAEAAPLPRRMPPDRRTPLLEVNKVRKAFGGLIAVNDVSFTVNAGEIIGLIGPNGAGKSTTFNLVTGVLAATGGEVRFSGQPVNGLPAREIVKRGIARTFQHVQLMPAMSVLENVAIGAHLRGDFAPQGGIAAAVLRLNRQEEAKLLHAAATQLRRVGLGDYLYAEAGSLALGQQRIVEIARALCSDPSLLLLDEPAAGLRYQEKQALAGLLRQLRAEGMSVLIVEHDMDFVMNLTDRLVVMEFGCKIAEGVPEAIQADPAVLEAYLGGVDEADLAEQKAEA